MRHLMAVLVVVASASAAFGYTGATVSVFEADVTTPNLTVFPVPAAAAMSGAQLLYDNSANLAFSSGYVNASDRNWLSMPLSSAGVTINNVTVASGGVGSVVTGVNNALAPVDGMYFTNTQDQATDPRFPTNIPRPGRDCDAQFSSFQFDLTQAAPEVGLFVARNSNAWSYVDWGTGQLTGTWLGDPGQPYPEDNNVMILNKVFVAVLGANDTFDTAQYVALDLNGYAPFIKVASNGADPIKSVCVFQDAGWQTAPTFGFFDVYATPEPVSLVLLGVGLVGIIRRRA